MQNEIIFIVDGEEVVTTLPVKDTPPNTKLDDKGLHTLSTKNGLKLSKHVQDQLGLKPLIDPKTKKPVAGDKVGYSKAGDRIFLFKTNDGTGKPVTRLGVNQSYVRLNFAKLWEDLKGNENNTIKYELGTEVVSKDGKIKAFELVFIKETPKQINGNKKKSAGKGKGNVKSRKRAEVDNVLHIEFPFKKAN